jgi:peptidyl-tRNA hydrolase, PTH1 family
VRLIVGLGNPGARYRATRHNAGAMVIDELAREAETGARAFRCHSLACAATVAGEPVLLAKPLTYMNLSGEAVRSLLDECGLDPTQLILVCDDLNLPFGRIRIRERGSAGGHKGMESVIRSLDSDEFVRVRLGIGQEDMPEAKAGFVLAEFPADQAAELKEMVARGAQAVRCIIREGTSRAMSVFNA